MSDDPSGHYAALDVRPGAEQAAIAGFNRHRGKWVILTWPTHARAIAFWRRVVSSYAANGHSEQEVDLSWGRRVALSFDNA